jgi:hypothetical protein
MKSITNTSIQSFEIYFTTDKGPESYWLQPQETVVVPQSYFSDQIRLLTKRRILRVQNAV